MLCWWCGAREDHVIRLDLLTVSWPVLPWLPQECLVPPNSNVKYDVILKRVAVSPI